MSSTGGQGRGRKHRAPSDTPAPRAASPIHPASPTGITPPPIAVAKTNKMTISSDYGAAREVQRLIREDIERSGFDTDSQFAIKLSIEEAIINAIKHGNRLDRSKQVQIEWRVTPQSAEFIVEDQGAGFKRVAVPNPTDENNLEKLTGRGILLMEAYMSEVEWSQGGRRVRLVKHNQASPQGLNSPEARSA